MRFDGCIEADKFAVVIELAGPLAAKHVVEGIDKSTFAPKRTTTRAEFVTMLVRALELEEQTEAKAMRWSIP